MDPVREFYVRLTTIALSHRLPFLAGYDDGGLGAQMPLVGRDLMPPMDTGIIKVAFETDANTSLAETEALTRWRRRSSAHGPK